MKKASAWMIAGALTLISGVSRADGNWIARFRAIYSQPNTNSGAVSAAAIPANGMDVNAKASAAADITYFLTPNVAANLDVTLPQTHNLSATNSTRGTFTAGTFKMAPTSLMLQYHFLPNEKQFKPYAGAGVTYTQFSSVNLNGFNTAGAPNGLESNNISPTLQLGLSIQAAPDNYLSVDVKKTYSKTRLTTNGNNTADLGINPTQFSVGYGIGF